MKRIFCLILLLSLLPLTKAEAPISISAVGGWLERIDSADLISGAGSDLNDSYESGSKATVLEISDTFGIGDAWRVDVKGTGSVWHKNFTLYVRRTSDGIGMGSISGGKSYMVIQTTDSNFFSGTENRSGIGIQYMLTGMSIKVSPNIYSTTITYTVVDI